MAVLDTVYRIFMFIVPYALSITAYVVARKALRVPQKAARIIALVVIASGLAYTLYRMVRYVGNVFANDLFEYIVIIVTVAVLALASIVMAIGQPEELPRKTGERPATEEEKKKAA